MKRLSLLGLLALSMGLLTGCPIFDDNGPGIVGCEESNCGDPGGGDPNTTTTFNPNACQSPADCTGINETCASDGECHTGDCTLLGCVSGFLCRVGEDMKAHCIEGTNSGTGGASSGGTGGTGGAGGAPGTGGASTGGAPGTGGASSGGTGGAPGTGGASSNGTGGAPGTGGASTGGAPGTGGTGGN